MAVVGCNLGTFGVSWSGARRRGGRGGHVQHRRVAVRCCACCILLLAQLSTKLSLKLTLTNIFINHQNYKRTCTQKPVLVPSQLIKVHIFGKWSIQNGFGWNTDGQTQIDFGPNDQTQVKWPGIAAVLKCFHYYLHVCIHVHMHDEAIKRIV